MTRELSPSCFSRLVVVRESFVTALIECEEGTTGGPRSTAWKGKWVVYWVRSSFHSPFHYIISEWEKKGMVMKERMEWENEARLSLSLHSTHLITVRLVEWREQEVTRRTKSAHFICLFFIVFFLFIFIPFIHLQPPVKSRLLGNPHNGSCFVSFPFNLIQLQANEKELN